MGVILSPEFKEKVVEMSKPSDRLIKLKLVIAGEIFSICPTEGRNREDKGGVFERLGRCDVESAKNREDCRRS